MPSILVQTFIADNNLPNLLFYGPPGTGKTSTILALAKAKYVVRISDHKELLGSNKEDSLKIGNVLAALT